MERLTILAASKLISGEINDNELELLTAHCRKVYPFCAKYGVSIAKMAQWVIDDNAKGPQVSHFITQSAAQYGPYSRYSATPSLPTVRPKIDDPGSLFDEGYTRARKTNLFSKYKPNHFQ